MQTDVAGKFSRWNEPFEEWFVPTIEQDHGTPQAHVLYGINKPWPELVDAIRNLVREQQERWNL